MHNRIKQMLAVKALQNNPQTPAKRKEKQPKTQSAY
jgi:hypothetical protein